MKKQGISMQLAAAACTAALTMGVLIGCGQQASSASATGSASAASSATSAAATSAATETASTASSATSAAAQGSEAAQPEGTTSASAEIANPWSQAATAEEAAKGAGLASFGVPDSITIGGKTYASPMFFYMDGTAQVTYLADDATAVLRKSSKLTGVQELAGMYYDFPATWTQNHKGLEITCYGNAQDQAAVILWSYSGNNYAISATTNSGSEPIPMTPDEVASVVTGIQ